MGHRISADRLRLAIFIGLTLLVSYTTIGTHPRASQAQASRTPTDYGDLSESIPQSDEHAPGTLYQDGPGETSFEQLPPESQQGLSAADEWVQFNHAHQIHQSYSIYTHTMMERAKLQAAEYQSGTNGLSEMGVTP
jgi:hypothetical protein